jgi:hypothetical protein
MIQDRQQILQQFRPYQFHQLLKQHLLHRSLVGPDQ